MDNGPVESTAGVPGTQTGCAATSVSGRSSMTAISDMTLINLSISTSLSSNHQVTFYCLAIDRL